MNNRAKIARPVRPEVADAFETDPLNMESVRSEIERTSFSAIAAEKVSSPTII